MRQMSDIYGPTNSKANLCLCVFVCVCSPVRLHLHQIRPENALIHIRETHFSRTIAPHETDQKLHMRECGGVKKRLRRLKIKVEYLRQNVQHHPSQQQMCQSVRA